MNAPRIQLVLVAASAVAALAGIALTVQSARITTASLQQIKRKHADIEQLYAMRARHATDLAAVQLYAALETKNAVPFADLLRSQPVVRKAEVHPRDSRPLIEGWSHKRVDVILDDIRLADVGRLLNSGENQRPPWRMSECTITPSDVAPGAARVTLVMETLEYSAP